MRRHLLPPVALILVALILAVVSAAGLSLILKPESARAAAPDQQIAFDPLADKTFGDADFGISADADSGLTVKFNSDTLGTCTLIGGQQAPSPAVVHIVSAGTCTIRAWQDGDGITWDPAPDVSHSFTIAPGDQTITFAALPDLTIGDPDFTVSATAGSGLAVTWGASGDCTNPSGTTIHLTAVVPGSCTVTASQAGDGDWNAAPDVSRTFSILAPTPTPTATATNTATPTVTNTPTPTATHTPPPTATDSARRPDDAATATTVPATATVVPADGATPVGGGTSPMDEAPRSAILAPDTGSGGDAARRNGGGTTWWPVLVGTALAVTGGAAVALRARRG